MKGKSLNRWVYAATGVIVLLFAGLVYAWSVLASPISEEFVQWTKAQLSLTFTIAMILFCIGCLAGGMLAGKTSSKVNVWISGVLFLAGFLIASQTQSLAVLYLGFGILGGFASGLAYNAVMSTMMAWFPDKSGLISGILLMGFGIGSFVIGKVYQAFTPAETGGWRISFKVFAVILFAVMIVCGFFFQKPGKDFEPPASRVRKTTKNQVEGLDVGPGVMLKRPSFWMYYLWAIFLSAAGLALVSQASGIAMEVGAHVNAGTIATAVGLISIMNGVGRVFFGSLFDKKGYRVTMLLDMAIFIAAGLILMAAIKSGSFSLICAGFVTGGFAYGCVTPTNSAIIRSFYGAAHYPVNFSVINTNLIIASFGSTIAGSFYDSSGSYLSTVFMILLVTVIGFFCFLGIRKP
ncbi:Inner membrane protein yhjX [uncultured Roseburia sp.]|uniref:MFS transporter n=1 Tax=Brotonthovivens ammoniilytica TaxID=2981725 RepID=A0ABT2TIY1_9FIRM|nr:MFS transporter [Brotonthovivens ammoniilytica]MCU6762072.1 MFS transporter [Brotonthovivens ammoniilytica]SCI54823.1 Inner membrane protein yhjX [uncultured Roseburia sp.]